MIFSKKRFCILLVTLVIISINTPPQLARAQSANCSVISESNLISAEEELEEARENGDIESMVWCLFNIGTFREKIGDDAGAIIAWQEMVQPAINIQNGYLAGEALILLGLAFERQGNLEIALDYYLQAVEVGAWAEEELISERAERYRDRLLGREIIEDPINYYAERDRLQERLKEFALGDVIFQLEGYVYTITDLGIVHTQLNEYEIALEYFQRVQQYAPDIPDPYYEAFATNMIGEVQIELGNDEAAESALLKAQQQWQFLQLPLEEGDVLYALGRIYEGRGRMPEAIQYYKQAIKVIEGVQTSLYTEQVVSTFSSDQLDVYNRLISLLWQQGEEVEAFQYVEAARARAFLRQITNVNLNTNQRISADLIHNIEQLTQEINLLRNQQRSNQVTDQARLLEAKRELEVLVIELNRQDPEAATYYQPAPFTIEDVRANMGGGTALLSYYSLGDRILAFMISRDSFKANEIPLTQTHLDEHVENVRNFNQPSASIKARETLYDLLIRPFIPFLAESNITFLGLIPHQSMHYLPFSALKDGDELLGEQFILYMLPSASTLGFLGDRDESSSYETVLAIGNPTIDAELQLPILRYTTDEATNVANMFGHEPLIGDMAEETAIYDRAFSADIIHLAAHGELDSDTPLFSTIHLAKDNTNDGRFHVYEIYNLDLTHRTKLVVLSACETQLGSPNAGDDLISLTRAFMYAGAPTIVASLWKINDPATKVFMTQFYEALLNGEGEAQALQTAQKYMREDPQYNDPYYWAAFVLSGVPGHIFEKPVNNPSDPNNNDEELIDVPATQVPTAVPEPETNVQPRSRDMIGRFIIIAVVLLFMLFVFRRRRVS